MVWYYLWTGDGRMVVGGRMVVVVVVVVCVRAGGAGGGGGALVCDGAGGAARYALARIQCLMGSFANASGGRSPTRFELAPTSPPVAVNGGVLLSQCSASTRAIYASSIYAHQ